MKRLKHEIIRGVCIHCSVEEKSFMVPFTIDTNKTYNEMVEEWSRKIDEKYPCLTEEEYLAKQIIT